MGRRSVSAEDRGPGRVRAAFLAAIHLANSAEAQDRRGFDRHRHRAGKQRDFHGPVRPGAGAFLVGPRQQHHLLLDPRGAGLGGQRLGCLLLASGGPRGGGGLRERRSGPADHRWQCLQLDQHAALPASSQPVYRRVEEPDGRRRPDKEFPPDTDVGRAGGRSGAHPCGEHVCRPPGEHPIQPATEPGNQHSGVTDHAVMGRSGDGISRHGN